MIRKRISWIFICISICFVGFMLCTENTKADELYNAYKFYENYGNKMLFQPNSDTDGQILYATKAKRASTGILYTTLGWKATIYDNQGHITDKIYYKLNGEYMVCIDVKNIDGYEYCLYSITLNNLRERMNGNAQRTLQDANARIVFDACTTTKINGVIQGEMTDEGPLEGKVYETYEEIVNAQKWSNTTKETLKSYFNKQVEGLFYSVTLEAGEGIMGVDGQGKYCFGTNVKIVSSVEMGYHFSCWRGDFLLLEEDTSFILGAKDITLTANAELNQYNIVFDSNGGDGTIPELSACYNEQFMPPVTDIYKEGYSLVGWSTNKSSVKPDFSLHTPVKVDYLSSRVMCSDKHGATIILYAVWDRAPEIQGEDIYVSLEDARSGMITEEWLSYYVSANDIEDGNIPYGQNSENRFWISDYLAADFTSFRKGGSVSETFCVVDSAGNMAEKQIMVHIVDTSIMDADIYTGKIRFISEKYYKDVSGSFVEYSQGGLLENSCWRLNPSYTQLLDALFSNAFVNEKGL